MARSARGRGGPGYTSLIVFIVLCLLLIAGYVPLVIQFSKQIDTVKLYNNAIEDAFVKQWGAKLKAKADPQASENSPKFSKAFFDKFVPYIEKGLAYEQLAELVDVEPKENPEALKKAISEMYPVGPGLEHESLRLYIKTLKQRISEWETAHEQAEKDAESARTQANSEKKRRRTAETNRNKDVASARRDASAERKNKEKFVRDSDTSLKSAMRVQKAAENNFIKATNDVAARKKRIAKLAKEIDALNKEILVLKTPPIVVKRIVTKGVVLQADSMQGIAIINVGQREGIIKGETFTLMRLGKGDIETPKGKLVIIRVDKYDCVGEIMSMAKDQMLMRNDIVVRDQVKLIKTQKRL
jgi:hypothetical protein